VATGAGDGLTWQKPMRHITGVEHRIKMSNSTKNQQNQDAELAKSLKEKQEMVEKLFQHTNEFLQDNKEDPLLIVEALAAILVRYTALLGPVEQIGDRLAVLERLISQESAQIQAIAKSTANESVQPPK
jgi:hypothetical protein